MLKVWFSIILFLFSFYGIGLIALRIFFRSVAKSFSLSQTSFLGVAATGVLVLLTNNLVAFNYTGSFWFITVGVLAGVFGIVVALRDSGKRKEAWLDLFLWVILAFACTNIVSRFGLGQINVDTGGYHLPSVKWFKESLVPLGAAHLHYMLAYNAFNFAVAAAVWTNPSTFLEPFVLNSVYFVLFLSLVFLEVSRSSSLSRLKILGGIALFVCLLKFRRELLYAFEPLNSISPDLGVVIFLCLSFLYFLGVIEKSIDPQETKRALILFTISVLLAVAHKISVILLLIPWIIVLFQERKSVWKNPGVLVFSLCLLGSWSLRTFLLSGCLLFPVAPTCVPSLPWALPIATVEYTSTVIETMAKMKVISEALGFGSFRWISVWWSLYPYDPLILVMLLSFVILLVALVLLRRNRAVLKIPSNQRWMILIYWLGIVGTLSLWFVKAPMPRYGRAPQFILLSANVFLLLLSMPRLRSFLISQKKGIMFFGLAIFFMALFLKDYPLEIRHWPESWPERPEIVYKKVYNHQRQLFYINPIHPSCWDSPLPCAWPFDEKMSIGKVFDLWPIIYGVDHFEKIRDDRYYYVPEGKSADPWSVMF